MSQYLKLPKYMMYKKKNEIFIQMCFNMYLIIFTIFFNLLIINIPLYLKSNVIGKLYG